LPFCIVTEQHWRRMVDVRQSQFISRPADP
jgi:hypothetical protein